VAREKESDDTDSDVAEATEHTLFPILAHLAWSAMKMPKETL